MTDRRRTDTRARIRRTALELFTAQGYEATGLAQVADRLGITRPAVYHHFRSKEELVVGSYAELGGALAELVGEPVEIDGPSRADGSSRADRADGADAVVRRTALLRRLDELVDGELGMLLACALVNEHVLRGVAPAATLLDDLDRLAVLLGGTSVAGHMRGRLALGAMVAARARSRELGGTPAERRDAALAVAEDLLDLPRGVLRSAADEPGTAGG